jgi:hypothetical protein
MQWIERMGRDMKEENKKLVVYEATKGLFSPALNRSAAQ